MKQRFLPVIILVSQIPILPQIGRYPDGYPPSQYPGSQIPGIPFPWPGRGKRGGDTTNAPARATQKEIPDRDIRRAECHSSRRKI